MARENKQKRDERRFGKADRLADIAADPSILGRPAWWPEFGPGDREAKHLLTLHRQFLEWTTDRPVIVADNATDYYFAHEQVNWDYVNDFPNCMPPFDSCYIESLRPPIVCDSAGIGPPNEFFPRAWGWTIDRLEAASLPARSGVPAVDQYVVPMLELPGIDSLVRCSYSMLSKFFLPLVATFYVPIDRAGAVLAMPQGIIDGVDERAMEALNHLGQYLQSLMLALCFMNCKNVAVEPCEPDRRLNRERRRAGLRPFVRFRTINIEPMKSVLKSEGGIEEHGLKRALHICRGHFATYTGRMFGRELEKPVTVWRPAHVRGSSKEGIIVSDYRVNAPKGARP
jgi:hypothetical protein